MHRKSLLAFTAVCWFSMTSPIEAFPGVASGKVSDSEQAADDEAASSFAADGVVERYLIDPRGEVEGLLLVDGTYMYVTSRAADHLTRALKPDDHVQVFGRRQSNERLVQPDVIENLTRGTTFIVPLRVDLPMQEQARRLSVTEMNATGTIRLLLYHPIKSTVQGMILSDNTQIRLPLDASEALRRSFQIGDAVVIKGNGTTNQFGRAIEVVAIGRTPASLVPVDAALLSLP
ncbi:MAG TPA: hypothetical protein PK224_05460 [Nitrospira sp.]|nr:hypothetical protein [Nitrospira sp.]